MNIQVGDAHIMCSTSV